MGADKNRVMGTRLPPGLQEEVETRTSRGGYYGTASAIVRRELERYYAALQWARRDLRGRFSGEEQGLVADVLNGTLIGDTASVPMLWAEIEDAVRLDPYAEKWHCDGPALVAKLKALTYTEACAFTDAVESFWARVGRGEQPDPQRLLEEAPRDATAGR
jgi:hypothetical protein